MTTATLENPSREVMIEQLEHEVFVSRSGDLLFSINDGNLFAKFEAARFDCGWSFTVPSIAFIYVEDKEDLEVLSMENISDNDLSKLYEAAAWVQERAASIASQEDVLN